MIYRFNRLAIFPGIVSIEVLPIPVLMMIDDSGKRISFEFLVLGTGSCLEAKHLNMYTYIAHAAFFVNENRFSISIF